MPDRIHVLDIVEHQVSVVQQLLQYVPASVACGVKSGMPSLPLGIPKDLQGKAPNLHLMPAGRSANGAEMAGVQREARHMPLKLSAVPFRVPVRQ